MLQIFTLKLNEIDIIGYFWGRRVESTFKKTSLTLSFSKKGFIILLTMINKIPAKRTPNLKFTTLHAGMKTKEIGSKHEIEYCV